MNSFINLPYINFTCVFVGVSMIGSLWPGHRPICVVGSGEGPAGAN